MWLRPSFLVPLKAEIKSEFFSVFGKTVAIPDEKLADFVQNSGFTDLISASAHFRRVIKYYSDKYTYIPTFNHLISERLPVLQDTSEWVHKMHASFPQFRPYLFSPAKSALSQDYTVYESMLVSDASLRLARNFANCAKLYHSLRYVPSAVILLERAAYTMIYRGVMSAASYADIFAAHNRLKAIRMPNRDKNPGWAKANFALAVNRRTHFTVGTRPFSWWDALAVICRDSLWDIHGAGVDREALFNSWVRQTLDKGCASSVIISENPIPLTRAEEEQLQMSAAYRNIIRHYPYREV